MKKTNILLIIMSILPIIIGIIIALNFFNIGISHSEFIQHSGTLDVNNTKKLEQIALVGDFFSGHVNGFILLAFILSLYFQKISIEQVEKSLKEQKDANEIIRKDMKESVKANTSQTKEFITTNTKNDFNYELTKIDQLENKLNIEELYENKFSKYNLLSNKNLIELLKRVDYLCDKYNKIDDFDLREDIKRKLELSLYNKYTQKYRELFKLLFVFNELAELYQDYKNYINSHANNKTLVDNIDDLNVKYEFLISYPLKQKALSIDENRYELFEMINCTNIFEKINVVDNDAVNINLLHQNLWDIIFSKSQFKIHDYKIYEFYNIIIKDYEIKAL